MGSVSSRQESQWKSVKQSLFFRRKPGKLIDDKQTVFKVEANLETENSRVIDQGEGLEICFDHLSIQNDLPRSESHCADSKLESGDDQELNPSPSRRFSFSGAAVSANTTLASKKFSQDSGAIIDSPHALVPLTSRCSDASDFSLPLSRTSSNASSKLGVPWNPLSRTSSSVSANVSHMGTGILDVLETWDAHTIHTAGGPAGEDRLQTVCSEEDGFLYCGIYDGFNGRDAADFVAANLYKCISQNAQSLNELQPGDFHLARALLMESVRNAFSQTEDSFLRLIEQQIKESPHSATIGCCIASVILFGDEMVVANLGDCRAVLATASVSGSMQAVQLTYDHTLANIAERMKVESEHPDEEVVKGDRVKGKLKITRAFGAGFLKHGRFNDAMRGIFKIRDFRSPPYIGSEPYVSARKIKAEDKFVVVASDGLFDFFTNEKLVHTVSVYLETYPEGDPAKFLVEEIVRLAAKKADISVEKLKSIPRGERRKYHDDVTVCFVSLRSGVRSLSASTRNDGI